MGGASWLFANDQVKGGMYETTIDNCSKFYWWFFSPQPTPCGPTNNKRSASAGLLLFRDRWLETLDGGSPRSESREAGRTKQRGGQSPTQVPMGPQMRNPAFAGLLICIGPTRLESRRGVHHGESASVLEEQSTLPDVAALKLKAKAGVDGSLPVVSNPELSRRGRLACPTIKRGQFCWSFFVPQEVQSSSGSFHHSSLLQTIIVAIKD